MKETTQRESELAVGRPGITEDEFDQVRQSLRGLLFGSVSIVIQDGVIVQIDRTEKRRLTEKRGRGLGRG